MIIESKLSRRKYIRTMVGGISTVLVVNTLPSLMPKTLALAEQSRQYPEPISDLSQVVPDSSPELKVDLEKDEPKPIRSPRDGGPGILGTADYGTKIYENSSVTGVYAGQEIRDTYDFGPTDVLLDLYAPTLEAPNDAVLESVTWYRRGQGDSYTKRRWGVWDHYYEGFERVLEYMNSTWRSKYTAVYSEGRLYFTEVIYLDNKWRVLLYNFQSGSWEEKDSSSRSRPSGYGWDIWESYFNNSCPQNSVPNIDSTNLKVYKNGSWYKVTSTYGTKEWDNEPCNYIGTYEQNYYWWHVN